MTFKNFIIFIFCLSFVLPTYAYLITDETPEKIQQNTENYQEQTFCHYYMGDWYGSSKYNEQSDEIIIENCSWGMGYDCNTYKIPKLSEFDNVKIYYSDKHPENIFINNSGHWKWKNAGCRFAVPANEEN